MATLEKIKERIGELAGRRSNVTLSEIEWVVKQLAGHGYRTSSRDAKHGKLFGVGTQRFMVNYHNPGNTQVKSYSLDNFLDAMIELGLYDD
jgi:hypothetical protein